MVFYRGFKESIDNFPPEERLAIYEAIMEYALNGTLPDLSGGSIKLIWPLIQPQLDANRGRRKNGRKGGAPRKTNGSDNGTTTGYSKALTTGSHSSQPNENENENVNENGDANNPRFCYFCSIMVSVRRNYEANSVWRKSRLTEKWPEN